MVETPDNTDDDGQSMRIEELEAEVIRLRALVTRLQSDNAALLRAAVDRDYERPPHYL